MAAASALFLVFDFGGVITTNAFPAMSEYSLALFDEVVHEEMRRPDADPALLGAIAPLIRPYVGSFFSAVNKYHAHTAPDKVGAFYKLEMGAVDRQEYCALFEACSQACVDHLYMPRVEHQLRQSYAAEEDTCQRAIDHARRLLHRYRAAFDVDTLMSVLERSPMRGNVVELLQFVRDASGQLQGPCPVRLGLITNNWRGMGVDEGIHLALQHATSVAAAASKASDGVTPPATLFHAVVESHKMGARKPDATLFVMAKAQLLETAASLSAKVDPARVDFTFFDDLQPNVRGALQSGVVTHAVVVANSKSVYTGVLDALQRVGHSQLAAAVETRFGHAFKGRQGGEIADNRLQLPAAPVPNLLPSSSIPETQRFSKEDEARLFSYLEREARRYFPMSLKLIAEGGAPIVEYFKGGMSNPTFRITVRTGSFVLRKQPKGKLLTGAHDVRREYVIMRHLYNRGTVPVPHCVHYCADPAIIGTPFYVMKFVPGTIIRHTKQLMRAPRPDRVIFGLIDGLAELHKSGVPPELAPKAAPAAAAAQHPILRVVDTWAAQYERGNAQLAGRPSVGKDATSATLVLEEFVELTAQLRAILSATGPGALPRQAPTLVHGDYKIDNMIIAGLETDRPKVVAILDFELAHVSDPLADLGYFCLLYCLPAPRGVVGVKGVERLPSMEQVIARYCAASGLLAACSAAERLAIVRVYMAQACHKLGGIIHGVVVRAMMGNASDVNGGLQLEEMAHGVCMIGLGLLEDRSAPGAAPSKL
jgi:aminoglycoside phosphotransferase (APT) family kinase protein